MATLLLILLSAISIERTDAGEMGEYVRECPSDGCQIWTQRTVSQRGSAVKIVHCVRILRPSLGHSEAAAAGDQQDNDQVEVGNHFDYS